MSWPALQPRSSLALAAIAELVGDDPKPRWEVASAIRHAMQQQLWDSRHARYYSRNLKRGELIGQASILSFMPLLDPDLSMEGVQA